MAPQSASGAESLARVLRAVADGFDVQDPQVRVEEDAEAGLVGAIEGPGSNAIVGRGGEVIDALQYLAAQIVTRSDGGVRRRVTVDADGYRARREQALVDLAGRAAAEALEFGEEIELDAMTPHDRRIVHMALKERTDVVTRSEGEEPRRRIIVEPAE
ncbi:MAG: R3H domain-containing nucleic acid-binding protein [Thermoleophilia bacterium]